MISLSIKAAKDRRKMGRKTVSIQRILKNLLNALNFQTHNPVKVMTGTTKNFTKN